jgi:hypothetical protein
MVKHNPPKKFSDMLVALLDNSKPFSPLYLHLFSNLNANEVDQLKKVWNEVKTDRRVAILEDLGELSDSDPLMDFNEVGFLALSDTDPRVRTGAIQLLWEYEDKKIIPILLKIMREDTSDLVRATAASNLGKFVYLGDMEDIPERYFKQVVDNLCQVLASNEKPIVRRRALEALSFHNRDDIMAHLEKAYGSQDSEWVSSALFGMGRSANECWENHILAKFDSEDLEVQLEAIRAAGELELKSARAGMISLLKGDDVDDDIRYAIIWSLSKIGGPGIREFLESIQDEVEDDNESDFISNALENLELTESLALPGMLDPDGEIDPDLYQIIDLEHNGEEEETEDVEQDKPPSRKSRSK